MVRDLVRKVIRRVSRASIFSSLDQHVEEVLKGGSVALAMKVAGAGLSFGSNIVLARVLGADGAGVYYLALTVTTVAAVVARVGLDDASLRFISASMAEDTWERVKGVYNRGIAISVGVGLILTAVLWLSAEWISTVVFDEPRLATAVKIMSLAVAPHAVMILHTQALKGLKKIPQAMLLQGFGVPLLSIPLFLAVAPLMGVKGAAGVWAGATLAVAGFGRYLWKRVTPDLSDVKGEFSTGFLLSTSLPLLLVASMHLVMNWTDTVMLGIWSDSRQVGIYSVAMKTATLTNLLIVAVSSIAAPKFSALYKKGQSEELSSLVQDVTTLLFICAVPLLAVFLSVPGLILLIFGGDFAEGSGVLRILALGQFVNVVLGSAGHLLVMTGHEKDMRNITVMVALVNVALNLALVPHYGIIGAATATSLSLIATGLFATLLVRRRLSIRLVPLG
jgi:O-antigen/teichoic acid export membrane protein